jgi:hypothetical protein
VAEAQEFFEAVGRSLGDAQGALTTATPDIPTSMAISEAQLDVRAVIDRTAGGLQVQPVGAELARAGALDPGLVSTVTVRFVPVSSSTTPARRTPHEVIEEVRRRDDLARLQRILGDLRFSAQYLPDSRRWLVTVADPKLRVVREVVLADDA